MSGTEARRELFVFMEVFPSDHATCGAHATVDSYHQDVQTNDEKDLHPFEAPFQIAIQFDAEDVAAKHTEQKEEDGPAERETLTPISGNDGGGHNQGGQAHGVCHPVDEAYRIAQGRVDEKFRVFKDGSWVRPHGDHFGQAEHNGHHDQAGKEVCQDNSNRA